MKRLNSILITIILCTVPVLSGCFGTPVFQISGPTESDTQEQKEEEQGQEQQGEEQQGQEQGQEQQGQEQQGQEHQNTDYQEDGLVAVTFTELSGDVINPERGFYYPYDLSGSSNSITASAVKSKRQQGHTILYLQYVLPKYMSKDIPESVLANIQKDMDGLRDGGAKCV